MQASVIIPFYKDLTALELILLALNKQSALGRFEVIIAEDDNAIETVNFLERIQPSLTFSIQHISQEDKGFRKCKALNNALQLCSSDYLIFIDGDCVPHKHLVREYLKEKEERKVLYGRRVNLSKDFTQWLYQSKKLNALHFFRLLFTKSTRVKEALYLPNLPDFLKSKRQFWGCNWAILKNHLIEINGFDEDYSEYGYEDIDVYKRLEKMGNNPKSVKHKCIVYHLYHTTRAFDELMNRGKIMFEEKLKNGNAVCKNGLEKL